MAMMAIRLCFKSTKKKCSEFRQFSPKVAAEVAAPLSQAKKITMVSKKKPRSWFEKIKRLKPLNVPTEIVLTKHVYQVSDGSGEVGAARITSEVLEVMIKVNHSTRS